MIISRNIRISKRFIQMSNGNNSDRTMAIYTGSMLLTDIKTKIQELSIMSRLSGYRSECLNGQAIRRLKL